MHTWHDVGQVFKIEKKGLKGDFGHKRSDFYWEEKREREQEKKKEEKSKLLSSIYGVPSVKISRAKNESSST